MNSSVDGLPVYPEWVRDVRAPIPLPPPKSCDCQAHIFGDLARYPVQPNPLFRPPAATFEDLCRVERTLGFERFVIVHSTLYGPDHRVSIDAMESMKDRSHIRVIGRVDENTSDAEIERLHALGFRGTRFAFRDDHKRTEWATIKRIVDRIRGLGWHLRLHFRDSVSEHAEQLKSLRIPVSVDHLGYPDPARGADDPTCRFIVERLKGSENWWVMLSNGNRLSKMESGWDDAIPIVRAYIEAAPDRVIWGSDWPHVQWRKKRMMKDAEAVELLYRYVDNDKGLIQKILVDNPARLHGFE